MSHGRPQLETSRAGGTVLHVDGVKKSFRGPAGRLTPVLGVDSLTVRAGELVGLRGPSGSGKTTLLHIVAGVLRPDAGRVEVAGTNIAALSEAARDRFRARHIGYVFQTFNLLAGFTARENVLLAMRFAGKPQPARAEALLARVGLAERMEHTPDQLSVGQQQRVAVARALANRPALVLADEPTGSLDAEQAAAALALIVGVCREEQAALLLVSHDPAVMEPLDRVEDLPTINAVGRPASPEGAASP